MLEITWIPLMPKLPLPRTNAYADLSSIQHDLDNIVDCLHVESVTQNLLISSNSINLVGTGDSYSACLVAQSFFEEHNKQCSIFFPSQLLSERVLKTFSKDSLFIYISSSGNTPEILDSILSVRDYCPNSFLVCFSAGGKAEHLVSSKLIYLLKNKLESPSIRTWVTTITILRYLSLVADPLLSAKRVNESIKIFLYQTASSIQLMKKSDLITMRTLEIIDNYDSLTLLGSGENYGVARYAGSKIVECTGFLPYIADLYEWRHTEYHQYPKSQFVICFARNSIDKQRIISTVKLTSKSLNHFLILTPGYETALCKHNEDITEICYCIHPSTSTPLIFSIWSVLLALKLSEYYQTELFPGRINNHEQ
jgi:glucosamine 6-phosphate synthetase-like amidotransferase/phosphosugar isomerase protein